MTFPRPFRNLVLTLALILAFVATGARPAPAAALPRLEADSLGGTHVVLPDAGNGKPFVILLAFTPESEGDLKAWSRALLKQNASFFVVAVADKQAFMSRKHIRSIVEGAAVGSREQVDTNVLITFSGTGWQTLTPPGDKHTAGVVVCDAAGNVAYAQRVAFDPDHLADVDRALK